MFDCEKVVLAGGVEGEDRLIKGAVNQGQDVLSVAVQLSLTCPRLTARTRLVRYYCLACYLINTFSYYLNDGQTNKRSHKGWNIDEYWLWTGMKKRPNQWEHLVGGSAAAFLNRTEAANHLNNNTNI